MNINKYKIFENFIFFKTQQVVFHNTTLEDLESFSLIAHKHKEDNLLFDFSYTFDFIKLEKYENILIDNFIDFTKEKNTDYKFLSIKKKSFCIKIKTDKYERSIQGNTITYSKAVNDELKIVFQKYVKKTIRDKIFPSEYSYPETIEKNNTFSGYGNFIEYVIKSFLNLICNGVKINCFSEDLTRNDLISWIYEMHNKNELEINDEDKKLEDELKNYTLNINNLNDIIIYLRKFKNKKFFGSERLRFGELTGETDFRLGETIFDVKNCVKGIKTEHYYQIFIYAFLIYKTKGIKCNKLILFNPLKGEEHVLTFLKDFDFDKISYAFPIKNMIIKNENMDVFLIKNGYTYYIKKPEAFKEILTFDKIQEKLKTAYNYSYEEERNEMKNQCLKLFNKFEENANAEILEIFKNLYPRLNDEEHVLKNIFNEYFYTESYKIDDNFICDCEPNHCCHITDEKVCELPWKNHYMSKKKFIEIVKFIKNGFKITDSDLKDKETNQNHYYNMVIKVLNLETKNCIILAKEKDRSPGNTPIKSFNSTPLSSSTPKKNKSNDSSLNNSGKNKPIEKVYKIWLKPKFYSKLNAYFNNENVPKDYKLKVKEMFPDDFLNKYDLIKYINKKRNLKLIIEPVDIQDKNSFESHYNTIESIKPSITYFNWVDEGIQDNQILY